MTLVELTRLPVRHLSDLPLQERNRLAVSALLDYTTLPYSTFTPRPDHVYITVPTIADLHRWAYALREEGVRSKTTIDGPAHGFELWVLHTKTPPSRDGYQAPLRIAAAVPTGAPVPFELGDIDTPTAVAS